MAVDFRGIWDENQKLFLSVFGLLAVVFVMGISGGSSANLFNMDLNYLSPSGGSNNGTGQGNDPVVDPGQNLVATPINNGKNALYRNPPLNQLRSGVDYKAVINTNLGNIEIDLYQNNAPKNVNNIVFLSKAGFYNGTSFHLVIKDYIIQGGDPLGTGLGDPGYFIEDEIDQNLTFVPYTVAMASSGSNKNGSQLFITTGSSAAQLRQLDGSYTIVGKVVNGFNVVDAIAGVAIETSAESPRQYMPLSPVIINSIDIREN